MASHVAAGLRRAHPDLDIVTAPVADGGDGTVDAAVAAGFRRMSERATGPTGEPVSASKSDDEGLLYADIDTADAVEPKQFHDVVGSYNRFDVFGLTVNRTRLRPARFVADEPTPPPAEDDVGGLSEPGR